MKSDSRYNQLDYQDRQTIAISLEQGLSLRAIGRVLNRSASTISREIARNSGGNDYSYVTPNNAMCAGVATVEPPPS
jgi:IS30 family transposase